MSLIELVVAMGITGIILAAVAAVFTGTTRTVTALNVKSAATADLRLGSEAMSRSLRVAKQPNGSPSAIVSGTAGTLSFYSLINRAAATTTTTSTLSTEPLPMLVEYSWDGTCLNEAWTPAQPVASPPVGGPNYTWPVAARRSKCLIRTTVAPAFSYYPSGQLTSSGSTVAPMTLAGTPTPQLTPAQSLSVQSVQVRLTVRSAANPTVSVSAATFRVTLQNVVLALGGN